MFKARYHEWRSLTFNSDNFFERESITTLLCWAACSAFSLIFNISSEHRSCSIASATLLCCLVASNSDRSASTFSLYLQVRLAWKMKRSNCNFWVFEHIITSSHHYLPLHRADSGLRLSLGRRFLNMQGFANIHQIRWYQTRPDPITSHITSHQVNGSIDVWHKITLTYQYSKLWCIY